MAHTKEILLAIKAVLSSPRIARYELATGVTSDDDPAAAALYAWNAAVSAAFLAPLHYCEVIVRNAVADAIEVHYGPRWPWSPGFQQSLPSNRGSYNPREDLLKASRRFPTAGKVIPELKFVFWQQMFDSRHEFRLWSKELHRVFPHLDRSKGIGILQQEIHDALERVRTLRNRIAHHEPIFNRDLKDDLQLIINLVNYRSPLATSWMLGNQCASRFLTSSMPFLGGSLWSPTHDEIAMQAYRFWEAGGRIEGQTTENWDRAVAFLCGDRWWDM